MPLTYPLSSAHLSISAKLALRSELELDIASEEQKEDGAEPAAAAPATNNTRKWFMYARGGRNNNSSGRTRVRRPCVKVRYIRLLFILLIGLYFDDCFVFS